MSDDARRWRDYPICPPCLRSLHTACDGDRWWCECLHARCVVEDEGRT